MSIFRTTFFHSYLRRARFIFSKTPTGGVTSSGAITESPDIAAGVSTVLVNSSGAITEASDSMAGVSTVSVYSSGAITEGADTMDNTIAGLGVGASAAFKIIFGLLN